MNYVDIGANIQVLGNLMINPSLFDRDDKYTFNVEDFINDLQKILFKSFHNLYLLKVQEIRIDTVEDYLSQYPKKLAIYKSNKGGEYLQHILDMVQPSNFQANYDRMKKMTLLREYSKIGMDVSFLYDPDNILDIKKKQEQEDWLNNSSLDSIADEIDKKITEIRLKYADNLQDNGVQLLGSDVYSFLEDLKQNPDYGYPLYGDVFNTIFRGARLKQVYLRSAATNVGKAIPDYTILPTPVGNKRADEIRVGDYLFGQDGKPTQVLAIYPQQEEKNIWEITFSDGRVAECCGEHLWEYRYQSHRGFNYRVEDTETIYNRSLKLKNNFKDYLNKGYRFHIKLNKAVEYQPKNYSVPPYVMGALLGDGSFRYSKSNKALTFTSDSDELPNKIANLLGDFIAKKNSDFNFNYTFKPKNNLTHNLWVEELFKEYPSLWNIKSELKFIPEDYLNGSIEQRLELLRGLLDTDGSIDKKLGTIIFTTVSPFLRDNVIQLVRSLGMIGTYSEDKREQQYTTGICFIIRIQCQKEIKHTLFTLHKKVQIAKDYELNNKRQEHKDHLAIINIKKTEKKTSMRCFTVANESHLFLTNDFIVTHNTRSIVADACNFSCNEIYDLNKKEWIKNGTKEPTMYITTEQEKREIISMCLAFLSGVNEEHILINHYYEGEEERVLYAAEVLKNSPLYIQELSDFSLQDVENAIKIGIRDYDVKYICFDYIHSSTKILSEISSKSKVSGLREDNILYLMGVKIKDIANKYNVFILTSTQLNAGYQDAREFDQNLLRGAKSLGDKITMGAIMLRVTPEDREGVRSIVAQGYDSPDLKISIYKNRSGRINHVLVWCKADLGICRITPLFVTDYNYEWQSIDETHINIKDEMIDFGV